MPVLTVLKLDCAELSGLGCVIYIILASSFLWLHNPQTNEDFSKWVCIYFLYDCMGKSTSQWWTSLRIVIQIKFIDKILAIYREKGTSQSEICTFESNKYL